MQWHPASVTMGIAAGVSLSGKNSVNVMLWQIDPNNAHYKWTTISNVYIIPKRYKIYTYSIFSCGSFYLIVLFFFYQRARAKQIKAQELKLIEQKKKQDELSRKLTDSANKSNVTRLDIIKDSDKQKES